MNTQSQLKKGILPYCVLAVVASGEARYGYEIVRVLSGGGLVTYEGTIYPLLARLRREGLVTASWQEAGDTVPRKCYEITDEGRRGLDLFREEWVALARAVDGILKGEKSR